MRRIGSDVAIAAARAGGKPAMLLFADDLVDIKRRVLPRLTEITDADLKDRRILGEEGFISVIVVVDASTGRIISGPEIHARGFAEDDSVFDSVKQPIVDALNAALSEGGTDTHQLQQTVRRIVGRWVSNTHRRRPMIIPTVLEV